jgi:8-oxo-dGTP pyrophosphatase MutT (NUDIX family)
MLATMRSRGWHGASSQDRVGLRLHASASLATGDENAATAQGWGKSATFTFPKGKVNKDEASAPCAVREVFEETGFDISSRLREENRIEKSRGLQTNSLYVIPDVPESVRAQTIPPYPYSAHRVCTGARG